MNNNIIIVILIIIIIYLIYKNSKNNNNLEHLENVKTNFNQKVQIKNSKISGLGVFAIKDIKKGEIIEECPCIEDEDDKFDGIMKDYVFSSDNQGKSVAAFGYCSLYNHQENCDAQWSVTDGKKVVIEAVKDIPLGKEIFIHYGDNYWKTRDIQKK